MCDCSSYDIYNVTFGSLNITEKFMNFSFSGNNDSLSIKKYVAGECNFFVVNSVSGIGAPQILQWVVTLENDNLNSVLTGIIKMPSGILITQGVLWNLILNKRKKTIGNLTLESTDILDSSNDMAKIVYTVGLSDSSDSGNLYLYIVHK